MCVSGVGIRREPFPFDLNRFFHGYCKFLTRNIFILVRSTSKSSGMKLSVLKTFIKKWKKTDKFIGLRIGLDHLIETDVKFYRDEKPGLSGTIVIRRD